MTVPNWKTMPVAELPTALLQCVPQELAIHGASERVFDLLTALAWLEEAGTIDWMMNEYGLNRTQARGYVDWDPDITDLIDKYAPDPQLNKDIKAGSSIESGIKLAAVITCTKVLEDDPLLFLDMGDQYAPTVIINNTDDETIINSISNVRLDRKFCTLSEAEDFENISGEYYEFPRHDDDDLDTNRGDIPSLSYGDKGAGSSHHDQDYVWFIPNYVTGSDYAGDSVTKSNYRVLLRKAEELDADPSEVPDACRPWVIDLHGGYSTYAIAFHIHRTPEEILDMLKGLDAYPLIDEDDHSQLEMEMQDEAWESWGRDDFKRALVDKFEEIWGDKYSDDFEIDLDNVDDAKIDELFWESAEDAGEYWETSSEGAWINVEKVAEHIAEEAESPIEALPQGTIVTGKRKDEADRMMDFFFGKKKDGFSGLSGSIRPFPMVVRQNQMDLDIIGNAIMSIQDHGFFSNEPGPHDIYALVVEYWRFELNQDEPDLKQVVVGYTHDRSYGEEVGEAMFDVLERIESFAGVFLITEREIIQAWTR